VPAGIIGAWGLIRAKSEARLRLAFLLGAGAVVPALVVGVYHDVVFGAPWRTGYSFIVNPQFRDGQKSGFFGINAIRPEALFGLTFGRSRGLFYVSPIALAGLLLTLRRVWKKQDEVAQAGLLAFGALLLLNASYFVWWGGAATGPRHLVACFGVLGIGLGSVLRRGRGAEAVGVFLAGAVSVVNMIVLTLVGLETPEFQDALLDFGFPNFLAGRTAVLGGASTLGRRLGLAPAGAFLVLVLWCCLGLWYVYGLIPVGQSAHRRSATGRTTPAT
jgi:hypothetical protein